MMKGHSERGVALVITLIMLALVTFMAVVFLAVSRREKASVTVAADLTDSKLMADAALARAQSEIVARVLSTSNQFNYELIVSTNFVNPLGFNSAVGSHPTNVSYTYANGAVLNRDDLLQNVANLLYDPRPPVFIPTNGGGGSEFRFYLDFNRNGRFEANGLQPVTGPGGTYYDTNGLPVGGRPPVVLSNYFVGDPEWVGVLERPDRPHSESNRFVGRYAFIILPAGKSLDVNYIHNNAKLIDGLRLASDGFYRNQGVGSWELNLAAFLADLNTNTWNSYLYRTTPINSSAGIAFDDARALLRSRYFNGSDFLLKSASQNFGLLANLFMVDRYDTLSDGPLQLGPVAVNLDFPGNDDPNRAWAGSDNPRGFYDVQELFNTNKTSLGFVTRLMMPMLSSPVSYDRYAYYRWLAQMGVDSLPASSNRLFQPNFERTLTNRLHLTYNNQSPEGQTNFVPWVKTNFFSQAVDRLIRASLATNILTNASGVVSGTNFFVGERQVRFDTAWNNLQLFRKPGLRGLTDEYTATAHRLLQLAANIQDGTASNFFPTVYRPIFTKAIVTTNSTYTNIVVSRFVEETNTVFLNYPWMSVEQAGVSAPLGELAALNLYGVPLVVGAKKGFPNFNEFSLQTAVLVSRKVEVAKPARNQLPNRTNQMYVLGISNLFGLEAWNSYTQAYRRDFEIRATNQYSITLSNVMRLGGAPVTNLVRFTNGIMTSVIVTNFWHGFTNVGSPTSFMLPIFTNVLFLTNSAFLAQRPPYFFSPRDTNDFESSYHPPEWYLYISNRVTYMMIDRQTGRLIDFVSLDNLVTRMDITARLAGATNAARNAQLVRMPGLGQRTRPQSAPLRESDFWIMDRVRPGDITTPTIGVTNQVGISLGVDSDDPSIWRDYNADPISGADVEKAIAGFKDFFTRTSTNISLRMQAPFTPTRKVVQRVSWQANDPLVHYTVEDLTDPILTDPGQTNDFRIIKPGSPMPPSNLGRLNERYSPWGGNPNKSNDTNAFNLALKDPAIRQSDDWLFPQQPLPNIGMLGRIHRGTPWQTVYLKSAPADLRAWRVWAGHYGSHPTNDWKLLELFTVAPNDNAARGLLSVNQGELAAWSAVLSGVPVLSNAVPNGLLGPKTVPRHEDIFIRPGSTQLLQIVRGINRTRAQQRQGVFESMGAVLATPELSDQSPFLNLTGLQRQYGLSDAAYERIPQQILSLLKPDETRVVVYAFGQALKPADRSLASSARFFNLCTNYQITGEAITKTVLRVEPVLNRPKNYRTIVESYQVLPPE